MTESDFAIQASYKFGPNNQNMVNVRGSNPQEFADNCMATEQLVSSILGLGQTFIDLDENQAKELIEEELGGTVIGNKCRHGQMNHKSGSSARGPWSGWMCSSRNKADQCTPIWD